MSTTRSVARPTGGAAVLWYPARGAATLWERRRTSPGDGIAALLCRTRAGILAALDEPRGTPELASRLRVTPGAVSQHLTILRATGLVATARDGRAVLHMRTPRAEALIRP